MSALLNPYIFLGGCVNLAQDWVKTQAPTVRVLVTHALSLCKRSMTSRSKRVDFLKQFVHKLLSDAGRLMIMEGMWHHDDIASMLLCRSISLWLFFCANLFPKQKVLGHGSTRISVYKIAFQVPLRMRQSKLLSRAQQWDLHVRSSGSASISPNWNTWVVCAKR